MASGIHRCPKHDVVFEKNTKGDVTQDGHPDCPVCTREREAKQPKQDPPSAT